MRYKDTVEIYAVPLDANPAQYERRRQLLDTTEKSRADRFRFEGDRVRWTSSRAALRNILGWHLDMLAKNVCFRTRSGGKPAVHPGAVRRPLSRKGSAPNSAGPYALEFSLSHSRDRALIAVSRSLEVGCDVEYLGKPSDWPAVSRRFFSTAEQRELALVDASLKPLAFFLCWTRKEAVIKATGEGLRADLSAFDVSLTPGATTAVTNDRRPENSGTQWHLYHVELEDDYVGAVAARADQPPRIILHPDWQFDDHDA